MSRMAPRGSTAVMNRRVEAPDAVDDFPTPPWGTRALMSFLVGQGFRIAGQSVWEPAANRGYMVRPLAEYFDVVYGSDVHDYDGGFAQRDFLWPGDEPTFDWIITNPPFRLADQFAQTAIGRARVGVALLQRANWIESEARFKSIFCDAAPTWMLQFSGRLAMVKGRIDPKASTATAYAWFVWDVRQKPFQNRETILQWLPPGSRLNLESPDDYPAPDATETVGGLL